MKHYNFMRTLLTLLLLVLSSTAFAVNGKWVRDRVTDCQVFAPEYATTAFFEGTCVQGRIHGYGGLSLYKSNELRDFVEGYFLKGMYIHSRQIEGELFTRGNDIFFHHNPSDNSRFKIFTPIDIAFKSSSICSKKIFIVTDHPIRSLPRSTLVDIADRAVTRYSSLCRDDARRAENSSALSVIFQEAEAFNENGRVLATLPAQFVGNRFVLTEDTLAQFTLGDGEGSAEPLAKAAALLEDTITPVVRLRMAARLEASQELGFPTCAAIVNLHNNDGLMIEQFAYRALLRDGNGQDIYSFVEKRTSPLLSGATQTIRTMLPQAVCRSAQNIYIAEMECMVGAEIINDCGRFVEGFAALTTDNPIDSDVAFNFAPSSAP